jgi:hypothetical protein
MRRLPLLILLCACNGVVSPSGLGEPLVVKSATFLKGNLPGHAPRATGETAGAGAQVTDILTGSSLIAQGQSGHGFTGHVSKDAYSIGVRFESLGSGYWLLPVAGPDPSQEGQLTWSFSVDFGYALPSGSEPLVFVAFDQNGVAGDQQRFTVCVDREIPDNLNACDAKLRPPAEIVALSWDTNADVDLIVHTPDGKIVDAKHPTTAASRSGGIPTSGLPAESPTTGYIDRDGNQNCVADSSHRENLIWSEAPEGGQFNVYVNLFSACGAAATTFRVTKYQRQAIEDGKTFSLVEGDSVVGTLLPAQANGGAGNPLYVTSVSF